MNDDLRIAELTPESYAALGELTVAAYLSLPGMPTLEEGRPYYDDLRDVEGRGKSAKNVIVAAFDSNTGALLGGLTFMRSGYGRRWGIDTASAIRMLAVAPTAQGRGVGEALLRDSIARARADNSTVILLHTATVMLAAQRLYERNGFKRNPELDIRYMGADLMAYELTLVSRS